MASTAPTGSMNRQDAHALASYNSNHHPAGRALCPTLLVKSEPGRGRMSSNRKGCFRVAPASSSSATRAASRCRGQHTISEALSATNAKVLLGA